MLGMADAVQKNSGHGSSKLAPAGRLEATAPLRRIAIQGERGSNSHMAALSMVGGAPDVIEILPCAASADVLEAVSSGVADAAVLPIENSLHGSVAEHYDLLLEYPVRIDGEGLLRIRHNLIAAPGVRLQQVQQVLSHPVALSQCRRFLTGLARSQGTSAIPFYDTAGSVKHLMTESLRDKAGVAPALAAQEYGAEVLVAGIEDHPQNFTRFHLLCHAGQPRSSSLPEADKLSLAFAVEHRPGTLVAALQGLAEAGLDLTKIESRPVPGSPWEYVFFVDMRFAGAFMKARALATLQSHCRMVKELGSYRAA